MAHPRNRVAIVCETCGAEFEVKMSQSKGRRFCSLACRDAGKSMVTYCLQCGKEIHTHVKNQQRYCSISCGVTARNLTDQNPSYHRDISGPNNPMYGVRRFGEDNPMYGRTGEDSPAFAGGRKVRSDGYIMILAPDDHPVHSNPYPYVLEHRLVMEQHLGRYLEAEEVVHHIDGDPSNNAIENLQLFTNQSKHISIGHAHRGPLAME